jgi:hypothetical protein
MIITDSTRMFKGSNYYDFKMRVRLENVRSLFCRRYVDTGASNRKDHIAFLVSNALSLLQQLIRPRVRMVAAAHAVVTFR